MNPTLFLGLDFEGSGGTSVLTDRAVQIGMTSLKVEPQTGAVDPPSVILESLINPGQYVTSYAYRVHGISGRMLRHAPKFVDLRSRLLSLLDSQTHGSNIILVAHSCSSEKRYLREILHEEELRQITWVDTLTLCRKFHPDLTDHKLETCLRGTGCRRELESLLPQRTWHDALYDSMASLLILRSLLRRPEIRHAPVEELVRLSKSNKNPHQKKRKNIR